MAIKVFLANDIAVCRVGVPSPDIVATSFGSRWTRIVAEAGVDHITFHDTRSTYITRLILAGVALPVVQRLAGHAKIETTIKYYMWVNDSDLRAGVSKLKRGIG